MRSLRDDRSNDYAALKLRLVEADAAKAEGDHPGGQIPQKWNPEKTPELPRNGHGCLSAQRTADQILLHEGLHGLDSARWPLPLALHLGKVCFRNTAGQ